uniref:snRNA-activating protein complex subunit 3 n=1 Tax=Cuerna arida TaxID=1464854 RepID=A0A1B6F6N8_9HEMI
MEQIYLKGFPREWHSEKIDLFSYFRTYSDTLSKIFKNDKLYYKKILEQIMPDSVENLVNSDLLKLSKMTNVDQLRQINTNKKKSKQHGKPSLVSKHKYFKRFPRKKETDFSKQNQKFNKISDTNKDNSVEGFDFNSKSCLVDFSDCVNFSSLLNSPQNDNTEFTESCQIINPCPQDEIVDENVKKSLLQANYTEQCEAKLQVDAHSVIYPGKGNTSIVSYNNAIQRRKREILLSHQPAVKKNKNLKGGKHFIVSFRIHDPFDHNEESKVENFIQEILLLDYQTLDCLRDTIICESDFQDVRGDVSKDPDVPLTKMSRDVYRSAMFYFDNTFYVDKRHLDCEDYSSKVKEWGQSHNIEFGSTCDMSLMKVGNLNVRFGYPYLYVHQGVCEHIVIINDARLVTGAESLRSCDYPMISAIPRYNSECCNICHTSPGCWIVTHNDRLLYDFTFMCKICFKMFNYVDGKKCGNFKAYRYFTKSALL